MAVETTSDLFARAREFRERGQPEQAIKCLRAVLGREPANAEVLNNLGLLCFETGDIKAAIDNYKRSLEINPSRAETCCNCANAFLAQGDLAAAKEYFLKALEIKRDLFEGLMGLASILHQRGENERAKSLYCDALRIQPGSAAAHFRLGTIMREWDRLDLAAACFRNAVKCDNTYSPAIAGLGETLQVGGGIDESEKMFRRMIALEPDNHLAHSNLLLSMNYNPVYSAQEVFDAHRTWGEDLAKRTSPGTDYPNSMAPERKLRLGYLSSDFCRHPAAKFLAPVLQNHDRAEFEVFCYSQGKMIDEMTGVFRRLAGSWREIRELSDDDAEAVIRQDAIDILIDCTGHMADNRLPLIARKCAPVQVSWIGYPTTTGLEAVDYRFTDAIIDPVGGPERYTEKPLRLEMGFCCWEPPENAPPVSPCPALRSGRVTFGSLHTLARLNRQVVALWSQVLAAVPGSRLLIFRTTLNDEIVQRLSEGFAQGGVGRERIIFMKEVPAAGHLALYDEIDISLDTLPWSGHTTACESLWMGVPVISQRGDRHAGRMVASVLDTVGLGRFVAETPQEFITIAGRIAADAGALGALRSNIREMVRSSGLCNGPAFTRMVEKEYRVMWRRWCENRKDPIC